MDNQNQKQKDIATVEERLAGVENARKTVSTKQNQFDAQELRQMAAVRRLIHGKTGEHVEALEELLVRLQDLQEERRPFGVFFEPREQTALDEAKNALFLFKEASDEDFDQRKLQAVEAFEAFSRIAQENRNAWGKCAQEAVHVWTKIEDTQKKLKANGDD